MRSNARKSQIKKLKRTPCLKSTENSRRNSSLRDLPELTRMMVKCFNAIKEDMNGALVNLKTKHALSLNYKFLGSWTLPF
jgi:hypothetical protein